MADAPHGGGLHKHMREDHVRARENRAIRVQLGGGAVPDGAADDPGHDQGGDAAADSDREVEPVRRCAVRGGDQRSREGGFSGWRFGKRGDDDPIVVCVFIVGGLVLSLRGKETWFLRWLATDGFCGAAQREYPAHMLSACYAVLLELC